MKLKNSNFLRSVMLCTLTAHAFSAWCAADQQPALEPPGSGAPPNNTAQGAAPPGVSEQAADSPVDKPLSATALEQDATLAVKVSFEAKRLLLSEVLPKLQQQSGITLQTAVNSPATRVRLTARIKAMPLSQLMGALSRMYGIQWMKTGEKVYTLLDGGLNPEQMKMLQIGDPYWFTLPEHTPGYLTQQRQQSDELADEIINEIDVQQLRNPQGVPLAKLSAELQQKIRHHVEAELAEPVVETHNAAKEALQQAWTLQFGVDPVTRAYAIAHKTPLIPTLRILAPNGSLITELPLKLHAPLPTRQTTTTQPGPATPPGGKS